MKKRRSVRLFYFLFCLLCFTGCERRENPDISGRSKTEKPSATRVSQAEQDAAEPAVAPAPDGGIYVVWVEHNPEKKADVFIRRFDAALQLSGDVVRVNPEAGRATAWRGDPPTVKAGADGTIYVGWTARVEAAEGGADDLYLSVSRDGAKTFDAPVKVNDDKIPAAHGMHALEVDQSGRVLVAWLDERYLKNESPPESSETSKEESGSGEMQHQHGEPNREVYFAMSADRGKSFSANKKLAGNVCPCCKVSIAAAPDGRFYVAWRQVLEGDFRHIAVSSSPDGGNSFAPATIVSDDQWQIAGCPVSGASLAVDSKNALKVIWFTGGAAGTPGLYQAESTDGGKSFGRRILISDRNASGTPAITSDAGGNFKVVFSVTDQNTYVLAEPNDSENFAEQFQIEDADLPGATVLNDKLIVAFVRKVGEKRSVFLARQN
jgi:hypothetical protein